MKRYKSILALTLGTLFLAACRQESGAPVSEALPPASVRVRTVERSIRVIHEDVVGEVRSKARSVIEAKVTGRIVSMPANLGQWVEKEDLLVELEAREIQERFNQAQAVLDQAERELKRYNALLDNEAVTPQEFDSIAARQRVASAALAEARAMFDYTRVRAPFRGVISRKQADLGDLASPGKALLTLEDPTFLRFEAFMPESLIGNIQLNDKLQITLSSPAQTLEGKVVEIAPSANLQSRAFLVKLDLPRTEGLRIGQFGRVAVPFRESEMLTVPTRALVQRGQMEIVFVAENRKARMRLVKSGKRMESEIEILSGLTVEETIVVEGARGLRDGQPLDIQP